MALWKLPPRAKIFEAFTAVADGRVRLTGPGSATVTSSGGDKVYDVEWADDGHTIAANDNASYWQGYAGYPIVAVLLARGELRADDDVVKLFAGVDWHRLNEEFRRDYDAAVARVLRGLESGGADAGIVQRQVDDVVAQLAALGLERGRRGRRPPSTPRA